MDRARTLSTLPKWSGVVRRRYESASDRCAAATRSEPARSAIVRATRRARWRPRTESSSRATARSARARPAGSRGAARSSSATVRSALREDRRAGPAPRGALPRIADPSPDRLGRLRPPARRAPARERPARRRRGRSGRAAAPRSCRAYRRRVASSQPQGRRGSPARPQGQGFIAATSRKSEGKTQAPPTRTTVMRFSSSGCRMASRTSRRNSGSSSNKRTPRCAREISPGAGRAAAAHEAGGRDTVMRRPERGRREEPAPRRKLPRDGMDLRDLDRLRARKRRAGSSAGGARASSCPRPGGPTRRT